MQLPKGDCKSSYGKFDFYNCLTQPTQNCWPTNMNIDNCSSAINVNLKVIIKMELETTIIQNRTKFELLRSTDL